jgi:hypothetical protein
LQTNRSLQWPTNALPSLQLLVQKITCPSEHSSHQMYLILASWRSPLMSVETEPVISGPPPLESRALSWATWRSFSWFPVRKFTVYPSRSWWSDSWRQTMLSRRSGGTKSSSLVIGAYQ